MTCAVCVLRPVAVFCGLVVFCFQVVLAFLRSPRVLRGHVADVAADMQWEFIGSWCVYWWKL